MVEAVQSSAGGSGALDSTPLCDEEEFATLVDLVVAEGAPRLFAVVQELGERVDGWVAAWGMAFEDGAELVMADGRARLSLSSPERALRMFGCKENVTARLVWIASDQPDG